MQPHKLTVNDVFEKERRYVHLSDYPYSQTLPLQNDETPVRCRARMIHIIGNPCPNAWMRNSSSTAWSESEIITRSQTMFAREVQIWPKPLAAA
jgi:hypothetical protein